MKLSTKGCIPSDHLIPEPEFSEFQDLQQRIDDSTNRLGEILNALEGKLSFVLSCELQESGKKMGEKSSTSPLNEWLHSKDEELNDLEDFISSLIRRIRL